MTHNSHYETVELFSRKIRITPNNKLNKNIEYIFIDRKIEQTSRKFFCKFANKPQNSPKLMHKNSYFRKNTLLKNWIP